MPDAYCITPEVLSKFKEPYGTIIKGTQSEAAEKLKEIIKSEKPSRIVAVGDTVTRNLQKHGIATQLAITDNRSLRRKLKPQTFTNKNQVKIINPQGLITQEAIEAIRKAMSNNRPTHILVEGEEDLLTLITVIYASDNALIVYGQPKEGIVAVRVTPEKRADAKNIFSRMRKVQE